MGFYVSIDKDKMDVLRMLQKRPDEVFGKPYGGYILFLAGGADQEILLWISKNISILDSLTGDDIAFGIFAQNFRCRLNMDRYSMQKNSTDGRIIDVPLEELLSARSITSIFKTGKYGWIVDGDEINAITYGTDEAARMFGVMAELPCMIIMDGVPKDSFEVFRLDTYSITFLITALRRSIQLLRSAENYPYYRQTMNEILKLQEKKDAFQNNIRNVEMLYSSFQFARYDDTRQQQNTDFLSALESSALAKFDFLLKSHDVNPFTHDMIAARKNVEAILTYNQTIYTLCLYVNEQNWPLEEPWLSKYINAYQKWVRFLLKKSPSEPDLGSPDECKLIIDELISDKNGLISTTVALLRAELESQIQDLVAKQQGFEQEIREKVASLYLKSQPSFVDCFKKQFYRERKKTITHHFRNKALAYSGSWLRPETLVEVMKALFIP
jgi:hypothetical protein